MSNQQFDNIKWYQKLGFFILWGTYLLALCFAAGLFTKAAVRLFNMGWNLW